MPPEIASRNRDEKLKLTYFSIFHPPQPSATLLKGSLILPGGFQLPIIIGESMIVILLTNARLSRCEITGLSVKIL
jgi:hypothetical protein